MREEPHGVPAKNFEKLTTTNTSTGVMQLNREASGNTTRREDAVARPTSSHDNDYSGRGPLPPQHLVAFAMAAHQRLGAASPWAEMPDDVVNHVALALAAAAAQEQVEERKWAQEAHRWGAAPVYTYENWPRQSSCARWFLRWLRGAWCSLGRMPMTLFTLAFVVVQEVTQMGGGLAILTDGFTVSQEVPRMGGGLAILPVSGR